MRILAGVLHFFPQARFWSADTNKKSFLLGKIVMVHYVVYRIIVVIKAAQLRWWPCLNFEKLIIFTKQNGISIHPVEDIYIWVHCMTEIYIQFDANINGGLYFSSDIKFKSVATHSTLYLNVNNSVHFDSFSILFLHIKTNRKGHSCRETQRSARQAKERMNRSQSALEILAKFRSQRIIIVFLFSLPFWL